MKRRALSIVLAAFIIAIGAPVGFSQEAPTETCAGHNKAMAFAAEMCGEQEYTCQITCTGGPDSEVKAWNCCCGEQCMKKD